MYQFCFRAYAKSKQKSTLIHDRKNIPYWEEYEQSRALMKQCSLFEKQQGVLGGLTCNEYLWIQWYLSPVMFLLSSASARDQTGSPLRLEKLWDKFSETVNSVSQLLLLSLNLEFPNLLFWNGKKSLKLTEENIEICCSEMIRNWLKAIHHSWKKFRNLLFSKA